MLLSKLVDSETETRIRQEMVTMDIRRTREVALLLYQAFQTTGIHGQREMPEDTLPAGVVAGSLEHLLFVTLTVSIDYQRDASALWMSAAKTFSDPETCYLFVPRLLSEAAWQDVRRDLGKYGLSKKMSKDSQIWRSVGVTFHKKWNGDPRSFLKDCGWDAPTILERLKTDSHLNNNRSVPDYPFLRGRKIGPLWLRMLRDNVGVEIKNLDEVPIPVDVHVARASMSLGVVRGQYTGSLEGIYEQIRQIWKEGVDGVTVGLKNMIALDVDEALWHLSRSGCTHRDISTGECPRHSICELKEFCVRGRVKISGSLAELNT